MAVDDGGTVLIGWIDNIWHKAPILVSLIGLADCSRRICVPWRSYSWNLAHGSSRASIMVVAVLRAGVPSGSIIQDCGSTAGMEDLAVEQWALPRNRSKVLWKRWYGFQPDVGACDPISIRHGSRQSSGVDDALLTQSQKADPAGNRKLAKHRAAGPHWIAWWLRRYRSRARWKVG